MPVIKELQVNGSKRAVAADADRTLLSVLRDDLGLTGCKYGCGEGRCGACTVLLDGDKTHACSAHVGVAQGKQIQTIEGLAVGGKLHALQQAFLDAGAFQCGYCTSGMIMAALALLNREQQTDREEIIRFMSSNICRCGAYPRIVTAIEQAARMLKGGAK